MTRSLIAALVVTICTGCQAPRLITSITQSNSQMKMVYSQAGGAATGVIQCEISGDGSLQNCRKIAVTFNERGGQ